MGLLGSLLHREGPEAPPEELSEFETALDILSSQRRRRLLDYVTRLDEDDGTGVDLDTLSRAIAAEEMDGEYEPREVPAQARKRVYVAIYQTHAPAMEAAGVLRIRQNTTFYATPAAHGLRTLLDDLQSHWGDA